MPIRPYKKGEEHSIITVFMKAFSGPPWNKNISWERAEERWNKHKSMNGFECLVETDREILRGAIWWTIITPEELRVERGGDLAQWAQKQNVPIYIWEREIFVDPQYGGEKIASNLRLEFLKKMHKKNNALIVLTRMRTDNEKIIHIAANVGFKKTNIQLPTDKPDVFHEYWYWKNTNK